MLTYVQVFMALFAEEKTIVTLWSSQKEQKEEK